MSNRCVELLMPDLDLGQTPITASAWLTSVGREVLEGERLLEVAAGEVIVDLPAPANGTLVAQRVAEDDPLEIGQVLAVIAVEK